jgi:predicted flavoprotein YhiN
MDVKIEMFDRAFSNPSAQALQNMPSPPAPLPKGEGRKAQKPFYTEFGPMLFTHFGISGPIIFNAAVALGEHINSLKLQDFISTLDLTKVPESEIPDYIDRSYILQNIYIKVTFALENAPKRIVTFF